MKHRIISFLLCIALLVGILPTGMLTLIASAAEADAAETGKTGDITNIKWYFDSRNNLHVTWDGYADTYMYSIRIVQEYGDVSCYGEKNVKDESENEGTFSFTIYSDVFDRGGLAGFVENKFYLYIQAKNFYGERLASGSDTVVADFVQYLGRCSYGYLDQSGIFTFDPVEHADYYDITMYLVSTGTKLREINGTTDRQLDCSDIVREGDQYRFDVDAYTNNRQYVSTYTEFYFYYHSGEDYLDGTVDINNDYTLTYTGYLDYLIKNTAFSPRLEWRAYFESDRSWKIINKANIKKYAPEFLRVTVSHDSMLGEITSPDNTYTNPDRPFYATDFDGLEYVFETPRTGNRTVYIKLDRDISKDASGTKIELKPNGGNIDLDLCGHTLFGSSYDDNCLIYGYKNSVSVHDSMRYNVGTGKWIEGRIEFKRKGSFSGEATNYVMAGSTYLYSGNIVNSTYSSSSTVRFIGIFGSFHIYGGTVTAGLPLSTIYSIKGSPSYGVYGGELHVTGNAGNYGIYVQNGNPVIPEFKNVVVYNDTGKSSIYGFRFRELDYWKSDDYKRESYKNLFLPGSVVYVDDDVLPTVDHDIVISEKHIDGPSFHNKFEVYVPDVIDNVTILMTEPKAYATASYSASAPHGNGYLAAANYTIANWRNGVSYKEVTDGEKWPGFTFQPGERYWISVLVRLSDSKTYTYASAVTATVNGKAAFAYSFGGDYYRIDYFYVVPYPPVDKIEIVTSKPRAEQPIRYFANLPENAGYQLCDYTFGNWKGGIAWLRENTEVTPDSGAKFTAGKWYTVDFYIETIGDAVFADEDVVTATVNGQQAELQRLNDKQYTVFFDCYCPYPQVDQLDVTVAEPKAGARVTYESSVPYDMGYEVPDYPEDHNGSAFLNGVWWQKNGVSLHPQDENYFEAGQQYTVYVLVDISDDYYFDFDGPMNMSFYINDKRADDLKISDTRYRLTYTFTVPENAGGYLLGDADCNDKVSVMDATCIQRVLAKIPVQKYNENAADADENGKVTIMDATCIQRYLAKIPTNPHIGQEV